MELKNEKLRKAGFYIAGFVILFVGVSAVKQIASGVFDWSKLKTEKTHTGSIINILKGPTRSLDMFNIQAILLHSGKVTHTYLVGKENDELLIIKEGYAQVTINSISRLLCAGSIAIASQGDRVQIKNVKPGNLVYYSFNFKPRPTKTHKEALKKVPPFFSSWDTITFRPSDIGGRRNIIQQPTSTLKQLEIHATTLNEGLPSHPPHSHPDEEIILVRFGTIDQTIKGIHYRLGPGSMAFATNDDLHGLSNAGEGQCEYFAIRWLIY
ncbi:MAG: cupin domain-containing protein [Bacteroidales bacterium]